MFTKCANWNCSQPFRYSRGAVVFRVETAGRPTSSSGEPSVGPQVDHHWLCAECLRVILISLEDHGTEDHKTWTQSVPEMASGGPAKIVRLTTLDAALAEFARNREATQTLEQARTVDRAETIDQTQTMDRTQHMDRTQPREKANAEGHPGVSGFEEAPSDGSSPQA